MPFSPNIRGALFMVVAMVGFTLNDAITKVSSESMNMAQVMLIRGAFASLFVGLLAWQRGALALPGSMLQPMVAIRVLGEAGATVSFLVALAHLPIANVSAVLQALPLAVTMGAALVFNEGVGWRRWLAIAVGFAGVLIIVRPGFEGFSVFSLLALTSVACCAVRDLATKRIPQAIPTLLVSTATALAMTVLGAALLSPMGGWTPMTGESTAFLALAAVLVLIGYQFIIMAMRAGDISFIAPFRYTALLWSILLGLTIFGDVPDLPMILGATVIIGSGLYALYRERVVGRRKTAAESAGPDMAPDGI
ncbi:DMT family transporter [Mesorhizobium sp. M00.F.Ca.ET.216.01.1.1]|uniref:DMT family transporter n=1 Tax=Mesorhizobium sp. M00.F.Ca.ET.216.01.1.1 TaxID=2500528 RepID=UPI000FDBC5C1|nr:DMT family transporter [Mesorhizobium sp. M00.F.Ca.ET.216.01.1.1]TGQ47788.1 DMT family transporter [Mesorhizobium sp. M00.F.Ca.ET.216.01.1.1]TJW17942.1 MAG: DMT family transporter [Mesorhizobium sp.]TJW48435.1 MAG: DMT family transporter [Mesorhizobium sp.]